MTFTILVRTDTRFHQPVLLRVVQTLFCSVSYTDLNSSISCVIPGSDRSIQPWSSPVRHLRSVTTLK